MKAEAEQEATKAQKLSTNNPPEKTGIEKRIREGNDDKVFKVTVSCPTIKSEVVIGRT